MRKAYNKSNLIMTQQLLGEYFDISVNHLKLSLEDAMMDLIKSEFSILIERGLINIMYEEFESDYLTNLIHHNGDVAKNKKSYVVNSLSKEYWTGWITAYLQWDTGRTFKDIQKAFPIGNVRDSFFPYHEMEDSRFVEDVTSRFFKNESNLKRIRKRNKMTQKELANKTDISIRTIQMIEQRHNSINNLKSISLFNLSRELNCSMEELLE